MYKTTWRPRDGRIAIKLTSNSAAVQNYWDKLLRGYPHDNPAADTAEITLELEVTEQLPPLPTAEPIFVDQRFEAADFGNVSVYDGEQPQQLKLSFSKGAVVDLTLTRPLRACGLVNQLMVHSSRFEDTLFTTLAPLLRRYGLYFVHAFGATLDGEGILIVGPSGSGKTTTGLRLMLDGWSLLANDGVMFTQRPEGVIALPTPGFVSVRLPTLELLPDLAAHVGQIFDTAEDKVFLTAKQVAKGNWSAAVPIRRIYFPRIVDQLHSTLQPMNGAVGLAYLMEESVDRWDTETLMAHLGCLQALVKQADVYELQLGRDLSTLPALLRPC